jgi:hypothetical protein
MSFSRNNGPSLSGMKVRTFYAPRAKKESSWLRELVTRTRSEGRAMARARRSKFKATWAAKRKAKRKEEKLRKQALGLAMLKRISGPDRRLVNTVKSEWKKILRLIKSDMNENLRFTRTSISKLSKVINQSVGTKKEAVEFRNDSRAAQEIIRKMLSQGKARLSSILTKVSNSTPGRLNRQKKAKDKLRAKRKRADKRTRELHRKREYRLQLIRDIRWNRSYR